MRSMFCWDCHADNGGNPFDFRCQFCDSSKLTPSDPHNGVDVRYCPKGCGS